MPAVVYYERKKHGKGWKWVKKVLITTHKGTVIYDGDLDIKNVKILNILKEHVENFEEFKKKFIDKES